MDTPLRLSNSEIETFQRCKRQHWWEYREQLEPNEPLSPLRASEVGTDFHTWMQVYYGGASQEDVLTALQDRVDTLAEVAPGGDLHKAALLVQAMVELYFEWLTETGADQGQEIVAPETAHSRTMPEFPDVEFIGKIDLETESDIVDFKTTKIPFATKLRTLGRSRQLPHYAWLLEPLRRVSVVHARVVKQSTRSERTAGPYIKELPIPITQARLRQHEEDLRELVPEILANYARETLPAPTPNEQCSWICPLYQVCGMADQGEDYQLVIDREFHKGDPLARYREDAEE